MGTTSTNGTRQRKNTSKPSKKMIRGIRCVLMLAALVWVSNAKSHKRAMDSGTGIVGIDKRYKIVSETVHWTDAIARCKKLGMTLETPTTKEEMEFLGKHIGNDNKHWVGATCEECTSTNVNDDKWKWLTGEHLALKAYGWCDDCPNDTNGDAKYLTIKKNNGKMVFYNHHPTNSFGLICQKSYEVIPL